MRLGIYLGTMTMGLESMFNGRYARGKPRKTFLDQVAEEVGYSRGVR